MSKFCQNFVYIVSLIIFCAILPTNAVSKLQRNPSKEEKFSFENFKDYNILLTANEAGVSSYSGVKDNLRFNFNLDDQGVNKINFVFDNNISEAQRVITLSELLNFTDKLMPNNIKNLSVASDKLYKKLAKLKEDRDASVFMIGRLRFECNVINNLINIKISS